MTRTGWILWTMAACSAPAAGPAIEDELPDGKFDEASLEAQNAGVLLVATALPQLDPWWAFRDYDGYRRGLRGETPHLPDLSPESHAALVARSDAGEPFWEMEDLASTIDAPSLAELRRYVGALRAIDLWRYRTALIPEALPSTGGLVRGRLGSGVVVRIEGQTGDEVAIRLSQTCRTRWNPRIRVNATIHNPPGQSDVMLPEEHWERGGREGLHLFQGRLDLELENRIATLSQSRVGSAKSCPPCPFAIA